LKNHFAVMRVARSPRSRAHCAICIARRTPFKRAYIATLERWPQDGFPANPAAWIITTARNRAIDRLRREQRGTQKHELLARLERAVETLPTIDAEDEAAAVPDDRLGLIFACATRVSISTHVSR
jgi:predicted RNA polymerase sigma factor